MRLSIAATWVAAVLSVCSSVAAAPDRCTRIQQRREFRTMSHPDRMAFISAVRRMQSATPRPNKYDWYVRHHETVHTFAHGNARFLSWHRSYLRALEKDLQAINPAVTIPYWDWATDATAPHTSIIFDGWYFGGNGDPAANYCVRNGAFNMAVWRPITAKRCIARRFDGGTRIRPFWSWPALRANVLNQRTYDAFRRAFELTHGNVHNGIGDMFMTMRSPDDPIFWLHHSFVDKVWDDWQRITPANRQAYGGRNSDGSLARPSDDIHYGYIVADVFDTRNLCYTYAPFSMASPPRSRLRRDLPAAAAAVTAAAVTPLLLSVDTVLSSVAANISTNGTVPTSDAYVKVNVPGVLVVDTAATVATATNAVATIVKNATTTAVVDLYNEPGNILNIGIPPPLPEAWCRMNNIPVVEARQLEQVSTKFIVQLNSVPGYVPECALVNHPRALEQLAKEGVKFTGYLGARKIEIPYNSARPTEAVRQVREKTAAVVQQVQRQVHFLYPKVIENIYRQVNVYNGGRASLPALFDNIKDKFDIVKDTKYGDDKNKDEDCEEDEDEDEDEDCEDEDEEEEDWEENEKPSYDDEDEDCEEEDAGKKPIYDDDEDCEEDKVPYKEY